MLTVTDIPLSKLIPSPANVRRTGASTGVEELAASITAHGLLQNLTVRSAIRGKKPVFEVIAGGRRLAALTLLAKRKAMAKNAPIPCHVIEDGISEEISLAENALQCPMHPADQFDAFFALHRAHGMSAEDIAARFGVTPAVVRQRLTLAALSPVLMQAYRDEKLNLDQLTGFAITDDHAKQEKVWESCHGDEDRADILAALNDEHVAADDPRAVFIGAEAYRAAGGAILRDLFDAEGEGFFTDPDLLNQLVENKLEALAESIRAEGWAWVEAVPRFDYAAVAGMRRVYPEPAPVSEADQATIDVLEAEYEALDGDDEAAASEAERIEQAIAALRGDDVFDPADAAMGGVIVSLDCRGAPRIERGYIRPGDDTRRAAKAKPAKAANGTPPLSEKLVAELTAHRTVALRNAMAKHHEVALTAVVHALAAATLFEYETSSCLTLKATTRHLAAVAPGIDDTGPGQEIAQRHKSWAKVLPEDASGLWKYITALDNADRLELLAHCVSQTVDAVQERGTPAAAQSHAMCLAKAVSLDMAVTWTPTVANYLGRVSKERILDAVREGVSTEAADNLVKLKKGALAEAAEQRLAGRGWLPPILRLADVPEPGTEAVE